MKTQKIKWEKSMVSGEEKIPYTNILDIKQQLWVTCQNRHPQCENMARLPTCFCFALVNLHRNYF
jgi:hypothetical protein